MNLIVRDVAAALPFYTDVLELRLHYSDPDFAALEGEDGVRVTLHADHTYDGQPEASRLATPACRCTIVQISAALCAAADAARDDRRQYRGVSDPLLEAQT